MRDMQLHLRIRHFQIAMIFVAAKHVGKSKADRKSKPWLNPPLRSAIKLHHILKQTVWSNREEYLRTKWQEFLVDFMGNSNPVRTWNLIKCLPGFPISQHSQWQKASHERRNVPRFCSAICRCKPAHVLQNRWIAPMNGPQSHFANHPP